VNRRARSLALWRGSATVDAPPATLAIETTTRCNLQCVGCLRRWDDAPPQDMADDVFAAALAWPGVESVLLYGLGEPLLDEKIFDRIRAAKARGLLVQLSTNATLLDEKRRRRLREAAPDVVIFSLDAADAETYHRVRGDFDFETVVNQVDAFIRDAPDRLQCVVQFVALPENRGQVDAFRRRFGHLGARRLRIKADETRPRRFADSAPRPRRPCPVLFAGALYLRADGSVLPCCHMIGTEPLGRLPHDDLSALWNSPRMQRLRAMHGAGRVNDIAACRVCSLPLPPRLPAACALLLPQRVFRALLPLAERFAPKV
jgi:radical SAM protein with 4Fe4S-binding SPASM domain